MNTRNPVIDYFRGMAVILMVLANFLAPVASVPGWLKHAKDAGLTVIDLIAPMFIFSMGLTYGTSLKSRLKTSSRSGTVMHFLKRYLAIAGIGAILSAGEQLTGISPAVYVWGVLQAIGVSGLIALPFLFLGRGYRLLAAGLILAGYQVLILFTGPEIVLASGHGGLPGVLGWSALLLFSTVFGETLRDDKPGAPFQLIAAAAILAAGLLLSLVIPVSKNRVSASYVLVSLSFCISAYLALSGVNNIIKREIRLLSGIGQNPLALYILHLVLLGIFLLLPNPGLYTQAPVWLTVTEAILLCAAIQAAATFLNKKKMVFSL